MVMTTMLVYIYISHTGNMETSVCIDLFNVIYILQYVSKYIYIWKKTTEII